MSTKLAISAALSVMLMAGYVVLGTAARAPGADGLVGSGIEAAMPPLPKVPELPFLPQ